MEIDPPQYKIRVYRQLREEGYQVGSTTVREYLAEKRRQAAEVYIPLVHRPGEEAQVDFFEVTVEERGVRKRVWKFVMRLMYAGWDFVWLYDRCDQVSFLDGHVKAFRYFDGIPRRCIYDNLSSAVRREFGAQQNSIMRKSSGYPPARCRRHLGFLDRQNIGDSGWHRLPSLWLERSGENCIPGNAPSGELGTMLWAPTEGRPYKHSSRKTVGAGPRACPVRLFQRTGTCC